MSAWFRLMVFVLIVGMVKANHIRMVMLAVLGLAGVWMMQSYAQGSRSNSEGPNFPNIADLATRFLGKRSIDTNEQQVTFDWDDILYNDVSTCARSFICQLAAKPTHLLTEDEVHMLRIISENMNRGDWASRELKTALGLGLKLGSLNQCRKVYTKCPYSSTTMLNLLNALNDKS